MIANPVMTDGALCPMPTSLKLMMNERERTKRKPPADDDPAFRRTCTRCYRERNWTEAFCMCGNPEFMLPEAARRELGPAPDNKRADSA